MSEMSLATKVTILCENMVGRMGSAEHGFAAYIERYDGNFLFDTGSGRFIIDNSLVFEKDLRNLKKFLSVMVTMTTRVVSPKCCG